jgi:small subunit ribosomal protein S3
MGQKVNPHGLRVGVIKDWDSRWYSEDKFADYLVEDHKIREFLKKKLYSAGVSKIEIMRREGKIDVVVSAQKPGFIIGKGGKGIEDTKKALMKELGIKEPSKKEAKDKKAVHTTLNLDVQEIKKPDADAQLVAENIASQLENRISFRRAVKSCMTRTMKKDSRGNTITGAQGIKAAVSGRLGGADIARTEFYSDGTIPLQTLRADIDYGFAEADTTYGKIGVKVWIYRGEILPTKNKQEA